MEKWARIQYQPNLPLEPGKYVTCSEAHIALSRTAAEEGMVLLKNNDGILPLTPGGKVCLFGKGTFDYVKGGGGSGDVHTRYIRNLYDGIRHTGDAEIFEPLADFYRRDVQTQYSAGAAPGMTVEPALPDALLADARAFSDTAIISICRFSGEGWDRSSVEYNGEFNPWPDENSMPKTAGRIFPDGDFYLTAAEKTMIAKVTAAFPKVVVVLNIGGIIDCSWIRDNDAIGGALLAWQGGMEGGLAAANLIFGRVNPSGKLPDTFAASLEDYPSTEHFHDSPDYVEYTEDIYVGYRYFETIPGQAEKVVYPFGYGLSYTKFDLQTVNAGEENGVISLSVRVRNVGSRPGKEVVQVYASAPQGKLGKAGRSLVAFQKTKLLAPGEEETLHLIFDRYAFASFDDTGAVCKSAYVLEKGDYRFYVGTDVRSAAAVDFILTLEADEVIQQLSEKLAPTSLPRRLRADGTYEKLPTALCHDMNECLFPKMVPGTEEAQVPALVGYQRHLMFSPDAPHTLKEVAEGKLSLDEFMAQLSDEELLHLLGGQPNLSVANTFGMGNLPKYGVPSLMTADGPAGVRLNPCTGVATTAWPCGTLLSSTWNPSVVRQVGAAAGAELKENNLAMWLTPAVNIHRSPLCGRNFEYYSEDPVLAGFTGAALVQGIQSNGVSACVKHFACNNKETNRKHSDSRVSQRALREIYLKAFEIIVRTADPWAIMSSYNAINGHRASECKELLEDILRGEWGYDGMVTTDWWTRGEHYKEILAGNDVKMATGFPDRVKKAQELGAITRADYEHCARRVLELILKLD
ncbi:MAG: glycoside hydrolase family 3 C-terminal domain-containing protein [Firmicutes bacterium]|nr:glycoside hydrolase family 3 C-terminal domain-containing protein [Bacillota bacterium]